MMKLNRTLLIVVSICLILLIAAPLIYWEIIEQYQSFREPINRYSSDTYQYLYDNETLSRVWNRTKTLRQMIYFSGYGDYSVLMSFHAYGDGMLGYSEWFVVASTLQPDRYGMIHELVVRFNFSIYPLDLENLTFVKSYENIHRFNLTSYEEGTQAITDFVDQHGSFSSRSVPLPECVPYFPFLLLFDYPGDFGETIILNLNTGEVMLAASSVWMGIGRFVFPEFIPVMGRY